MPRQARKISTTNIYHVMMRGINKEKIFDSTYKKSVFKRLLDNNMDLNIYKIYAYCIMDNHYHLIIETSLNDLSKLMHKVNVSYAKYYNDNFERIGPVFNNRYKSECVESNEYLIAAIKYVHDNPVKARMINNPKEYHWSSAKGYINKNGDGLVTSEIVREVLDIYFEEKKYFDSFLKNKQFNFIDVKQIEGFAKGKEYINHLKKECDDKSVLIKEILLNTDLSYRQISSELNVSQSFISRLKKQM